jgi:hypothetical protein
MCKKDKTQTKQIDDVLCTIITTVFDRACMYTKNYNMKYVNWTRTERMKKNERETGW